jgi:hypothetical protein
VAARTRRPGPRLSPRPPRSRLRLPTLELFGALHGGAFSASQRPLTQRELELARPIFGASIRYDDVRIVEAWFANAPTTLGNHIRITPDSRISDAILIHELAHIWQFQTRGTEYISNSLCAQVSAMIAEGDRSGAYRVAMTEIERAATILDLPAEKQAMVVEIYFRSESARSNPHFQRMLREVQAARPRPMDAILHEAAWGPGRPTLHPSDDDHPQVVPLIRFEF